MFKMWEKYEAKKFQLHAVTTPLLLTRSPPTLKHLKYPKCKILTPPSYQIPTQLKQK